MPTVADVSPISAALSRLAPGAPLTHGAVTVVPLLAEDAPDPGWLTLAESGEAVALTEVSAEGVVSALAVANGADRPLLLLAGQELVGAKQNRVLNTTALVDARARLTLPVSCVEQGRWSARSRRFAHADTTLYASARARMAARVSASLRRGAGHRSDQSEVWSDIAMHAAALRVESPTGAMHDAYARHAGEMAAARTALEARPTQVGAVVYLAGRRGQASWIGLDVLPSPRLFGGLWPVLCVGYAAEGLGLTRPGKGRAPAGEAGAERVPPAEILALLLRAPVAEAPAVGLGTELRIADPWVHGAALTVGEATAHVMAFPAPRA